MNPRNLRRTRTALLVPIAALTASVVALEARDGVTPTSIQSDAASTASTPGARPSTGTESMLAAPTTVSTPPASAAPGAVGAPASVTRGGAVVGAGLPPLRARAGTAGFSTAADAVATSAIPSVALAAYQRAASVIDQADSGCRLDWQLLAAIGQVESGNGTSGGSQLSAAGVASPAIYGPSLTGRKHTARITDTDDGAIDGDKRFDRAVGPMQILPATWVQIAVDGDGDGRRDPQDINDAALASAVYLCSTGTDLSAAPARQAALLRYNHSASYAAEVLAIAATYTSDDQSTTIPATLLLPPDGGSTTPAATPSGGSGGTKQAKHKHAKHAHHHHGATGLKPDGGAPQDAQQSAQQPPEPTRPTKPTKPAGAQAATAAQLDDLCRPAIVQTYPDATDDAVDAATAECITKLTGRTLAQVRAQLDDLVTDPDLAADVPDLGQAISATPSDAPSGSPTSDPTVTPTDGTSPDPSASATTTPSGAASANAPATSAAG